MKRKTSKIIRKTLTKEYLISLGIEVKFDKDGTPHIFTNGNERKFQPSISKINTCKNNKKFNYLKLMVLKRDENGKPVYKYDKKYKKGYTNIYEYLYVSRIIAAWVWGICPANMIVDHVDNNCDRLDIKSYKPSNLKIITYSENAHKDKETTRKIILKKKKYTIEELDNILLIIESKYNEYINLQNQEELHKIRQKRSYYKALKKGLEYEII
ncbi:MAG: hypothetical protein J6Y28_08660 [Acholeplasmatales bacterium]|nr:hypothetical protein [Acholeplasmatales bacterium]